MPRMVRSRRTWRSFPQPTVLLAPSRRTRRTWSWTSLLISRRERLVLTSVEPHPLVHIVPRPTPVDASESSGRRAAQHGDELLLSRGFRLPACHEKELLRWLADENPAGGPQGLAIRPFSRCPKSNGKGTGSRSHRLIVTARKWRFVP